MNYILDMHTLSYIMHHRALSIVETLDEKMRAGHGLSAFQ